MDRERLEGAGEDNSKMVNLEKFYNFANPYESLSILKEIPKEEFLANKKEGKACQEMWIGSLFCYGLNRLRNKDYRVRLVEEEKPFPDFELKRKGELLSFEAKEVQKEDRKRGDELKNRIKQSKFRKVETCTEEAFISRINNEIQRKVKHYSYSSSSIVFYINLGYYFSKVTDDGVKKIAKSIEGEKPTFDEIWILQLELFEQYSIAKVFSNTEKLCLFKIKE